MNKYFIICIIFIGSNLIAQIGNKMEYKLTITSNDNNKQRSLLKACNPDEAFEGCFSDNHLYDFFPAGKLQMGGFTFLDTDVYGWELDGLKKQWLKNNFTEIGMSTFPSSPEFMKALSFRITALYDEKRKDSLHIYFKYAIQSLKDSSQIHKTEFDLKTRLDYKYFVVPIGKEVKLDFLANLFKGYSFTLFADYYRDGIRNYSIDFDPTIAGALKKSTEESTIADKSFNFQVTFNRRSNLPVKHTEPVVIMSSLESNGLSVYSYLVNKSLPYNNINEKSTSIYNFDFEVPFILFNKEKRDKYSKFKNSSDYLKSKYHIIIIPISFSIDGIVSDIFIDYSKLNLNDKIKRWTPISKRVVIPYTGGIKIEIPKENWTANFTREGKQYDIYGYPDCEKFIDETIYISIRK